MSKEFITDPPEFIKYEVIEAALEEFEKQRAGLPKWTELEAPEYLSISIEQIRKKTPEELSEAAFVLNQYLLNIQRLINRLKSWERWAKSKLDEVSAGYIKDIPSTYGFNERMAMARHIPEHCKLLNKFIRELDLKITRLINVPDNIQLMIESIRDIKFANMRREKQYAKED